MRWALLRGDVRGTRSTDDVDVLIDSGDRKRACGVLLRLGFVRLDAWGRRPHEFFVAYHAETDVWLRLDVVSALSFGRYSTIELEGIDGVLERRRQVGPVATLDPDDQFWTLLLHCLLDEGGVSEQYAARLSALATTARPDGQLARQLSAAWPRGWDATEVIAAARRGDWSSLASMGREVRERWTRRRVLRAAFRRVTNGLLRRATRLLLVPRRGLTVALLAPDGAGKTSVASRLQESFGFPVRLIYMGRADSSDASPRRRGRTSIVRRLALQWHRYLGARFHQARGRLVVFDRYTYDARLAPLGEPKAIRRLRRRIMAHSLPAPHLVILLDVPAEVMFLRKGEHSVEQLERRRRDYLDLGSRLPSTVVIDAAKDLEAVRRDVTAAVWSAYRCRLGEWA